MRPVSKDTLHSLVGRIAANLRTGEHVSSKYGGCKEHSDALKVKWFIDMYVFILRSFIQKTSLNKIFINIDIINVRKDMMDLQACR